MFLEFYLLEAKRQGARITPEASPPTKKKERKVDRSPSDQASRGEENDLGRLKRLSVGGEKFKQKEKLSTELPAPGRSEQWGHGGGSCGRGATITG